MFDVIGTYVKVFTWYLNMLKFIQCWWLPCFCFIHTSAYVWFSWCKLMIKMNETCVLWVCYVMGKLTPKVACCGSGKIVVRTYYCKNFPALGGWFNVILIDKKGIGMLVKWLGKVWRPNGQILECLSYFLVLKCVKLCKN